MGNKSYTVTKTFYDVYGDDGKVNYNSSNRTITTDECDSSIFKFEEGAKVERIDGSWFVGDTKLDYNEDQLDKLNDKSLLMMFVDETEFLEGTMKEEE